MPTVRDVVQREAFRESARIVLKRLAGVARRSDLQQRCELAVAYAETEQLLRVGYAIFVHPDLHTELLELRRWVEAARARCA